MREMLQDATTNFARASKVTATEATGVLLDVDECVDCLGNELFAQPRPLVFVPLRDLHELKVGFIEKSRSHFERSPRSDCRARSTDSRQSTSLASPRSAASTRRSISASHSCSASASGTAGSRLAIKRRASSARSSADNSIALFISSVDDISGALRLCP